MAGEFDRNCSIVALGVQRLAGITMRIRGGNIRIGMTEHRLAGSDVLRCVIDPSAETVPKAVPTGTLAIGYKAEGKSGF